MRFAGFGSASHSHASMHQPAGRFCKATLPEHHRAGGSISESDKWQVVVGSPGLVTCHSSLFVELKPQQTGTGLLIRHGEVATTSGSTISMQSAE